MTIISEFGSPRSRLPVALEQLVAVHSVTSDLRWAMVELAWRSFTAMCGFAQGRFVLWTRGHRRLRQQAGGGRHCCC